MGKRAERIRAEEKIYGYTDTNADRHTVDIHTDTWESRQRRQTDG
jgi:hypothetical protein